APLKETVSVPLQGIANGKLELSAANGKWSKATGSFTLNVSGMVMGDGKEKFRGLATLPPANVGAFEMIAKADAGVLKIEKLGATGGDLDLVGDGTIKLKEPWDSSGADLWLRFGFSEEYKHKDERTEALFVDDGPFPALISQDRKMKRAKRADGMWGFHIHGKLARLRYDPTTADGPKGKAGASTADAAKKKKSDDDDDDDVASAPATAPRKSPTFTKPGGLRPPPDVADPPPTPDATPEPQEPEPTPAPEPDGVPPSDPPAPQEPPSEPQEEPAPAPQ
ncbi:MAG: type II secretion system protein GspN, partial [Myxococcales bacterium]|nr:type II secretion system protein GspN [Myxococcales bacterium]